MLLLLSLQRLAFWLGVILTGLFGILLIALILSTLLLKHLRKKIKHHQ